LLAALVLIAPSALAAGHALGVAPHQLNFGKRAFGSTTSLTLTITNTSRRPVFVSIQGVSVPDTFNPGQDGSTCSLFATTRLEPGESCSYVVGFFADPAPTFAGRQTGALAIRGSDAQGAVVYSRIVKMSGRGVRVEPTLTSLIDARDRAGIRTWAAARSIATITGAVAALDQAHRERLPVVVLDTNATGTDRDKMLRVMGTVLADRDLGFYAEVWSYTFVELTGDGLFGTCGHLFLSPSAWAGLSDADARDVLMHESFHSFDCVNGGPVGALDEGAAIWVFKAFFPEGRNPAETWAEATYGTKLYYRDIQGQPDYPLAVAQNPTQKLLDVYRILSNRDPSRLPWDSQERLATCYQRYFEQLDRNVDFFAVWLPSVQQATNAMLADPGCSPV
jgi:hypothetical protein